MTSVCINLIPDHRQQAHAARVRLGRWILAGAGYGLVLLVVFGLLRIVWDPGDLRTASAITDVRTRIATVSDSITDIRSELDHHQKTLRANRDLIEHPDWGQLLALLAKTLGDDLVLRQCQIERLVPTGGPTQPDRDAAVPAVVGFQLAIRGLGRTQEAVSQFALRLELAGLFDDVKLVDTSLEPFLAGKAVAFHLECRLGAAGESTP